MTDIDMQLVPRVRHDVRRRRYGVLTLLIRKNELPLGRIASDYGEAFQVPLGEALAATIVTIARFQAYELISNIFDPAAMLLPGDMQKLAVCPEIGSA